MCLGYIYIFGFSIFRRFSSHMIDFNGDSLCAYRKSLLIKVDQEVYTGISVSTFKSPKWDDIAVLEGFSKQRTIQHVHWELTGT